MLSNSNRSAAAALLLGCVAVLAPVLTHASTRAIHLAGLEDEPLESLQVMELTLTDENGGPRIVLGAYDAGPLMENTYAVRILDAEGRPRQIHGVSSAGADAGSWSQSFDERGVLRSFQHVSNHAATLVFLGPDATPRAQLICAEGVEGVVDMAALNLFDTAARLGIQVARRGDLPCGNVYGFAADGNAVWSHP